MKDKEFQIKITGDAGGAARAEKSAEETRGEDAETKKLATELEDLRASMLRHQADFANFRKRAEKEQREAGQRATARVIEQLIPVIDGFEHALAAHREPQYESYRKGFELIYKQLLDNLAKLGAQRIEPQGMPFDPHLHQAVDRLETSEHADGTVLVVYQAGYLYHGRVLRPAMVRVAVQTDGASKRFAN